MLKSNDEITRDLDDVIACVFASMMSLRCEPHGKAGKQDENISARVEFLGALTGSCAVTLQPSGAAALVRAMLDIDVKPGDELSDDAVRELCNMIAGSWKSGLCLRLGTSVMSPPKNYAFYAEVPDDSTIVRQYNFSEHLLTVSLRLNHKPA